jgi:hypothetical protein
MPITIQNSAGGGVTLDSTTSSNETLQLPSGGGTLAPLASPVFTGNVGIGVTPETDWHSNWSAVQIGNSSFASTSNNDQTYFSFNARSTTGSSNTGNKYITNGEKASQYLQASGNHLFKIAAAGTADAAISWTTAMTIDNSSNVLVGKTTTALATAGLTFGSTGFASITRDGYEPLSLNRLTSGGDIAKFYKDGTAVGSIGVNASATSFNTSSDYRLKENVTPMSGATAQTKLLKPCNFDWITGGNVNGFIAHELAEVVPEAVTGTKDAMRDEEYEVTTATDTEEAVMGTRSVPDMQGIDQSKLVPLLTATIQELIARIEALEGE